MVRSSSFNVDMMDVLVKYGWLLNDDMNHDVIYDTHLNVYMTHDVIYMTHT